MESAFLKHITDDPDDVVSRLVFADWLCEQDDRARNERGEFIRLQHALAAGTVPAPDRLPLLARQKELLARHRDRWEEPFRGLVNNCEYRNGFAERVTLTANEFVHGFADLARLAPVVRVRLRGLTADTAADVAAAGALAGLRELDLDRTPVPPAVLRTLLGSPHMTRLRSLQLARTGVGDEGVRALVAAPVFRRLRYLNLSHTDVTTAGLSALVVALRNRATALQTLVLRGAPRLSPGALLPLPHSVPYPLRQSLQAQIGLEMAERQDLLARLYAERATLSPDLRRWVEWLRAHRPGEFRRAVKELPLPDPVKRVFTVVCQRRVVWRANRLGFFPPDEDSNSEDLQHLLKLLFDMADTKKADDTRREMTFQIECLLDLFMRSERGDLPADGKTRPALA